MWVVCISPRSEFQGRVGLVDEKQWEAADDYIRVQFGTSGPFRRISKNSLLSARDIVTQLERNTGQRGVLEILGME